MSSLLTRTLSNGATRERARSDPYPALFLLFEGGAPTGVRTRLEDGLSLVVGRGDARSLVPAPEPEVQRLFLPDPWLSGMHARFERVVTAWAVEDLGSKNGTWVNGRRERRVLLEDGDVIQVGHSLFLFRADTSELLDEPQTVASALPELLTFQRSLLEQLTLLRLTAQTHIPVLVQGPSGSGKERVARAAHLLSGRTGDWVPVNCGALPESLVASEIFGAKRGAYSGAAADRHGYLVAAHQGTLFLDEVAELPPSAQAALLRALQEGQSQVLGTTRQVAVDFQLVCATNAELSLLVTEGRFRQDLLARIAGLEVRLPSLAQRLEDLGLLIASVLRLRGHTPEDVRFEPDAARALVWYTWPLNLRELDRALMIALAQSQGERVSRERLPQSIARVSQPGSRAACAVPPVEDVRRAELTQSLLRHGGNVAAVAREMGKGRMQIHRWLRKYGMDVARFRP